MAVRFSIAAVGLNCHRGHQGHLSKAHPEDLGSEGEDVVPTRKGKGVGRARVIPIAFQVGGSITGSQLLSWGNLIAIAVKPHIPRDVFP
jgi:hypothetical protein